MSYHKGLNQYELAVLQPSVSCPRRIPVLTLETQHFGRYGISESIDLQTSAGMVS